MCADLNTGDVQVVQLGQNSSVLDGMEMIKDKMYVMKPNSTLHVLMGLFPQKLDIINNSKEPEDKKQRHKSASEVDDRKSSSSSSHHKSKDRPSSCGSTPGSNKDSVTNPSSKRQHEEEPEGGSAKKPKLKDDSKVPKRRHSADKPEGSSAKKVKLAEESKPPQKSQKAEKLEGSSAKKLKSSNDSEQVKLNGMNNSATKHLPVERHKSEDDNKHLEGVAAQLNAMKSAKSRKRSAEPFRSSETLPESSKVTKITKEETASKGSPGVGTFSSPFDYPTWTGPLSDSRWDQYESLYIYSGKGLEHRKKIAGFDIDGTIITTKSGKVFATDRGDWKLLFYKEIPKKLKKLHFEDGYKVVFFTNQLGVSKGKITISDLKLKFEDIVREVGVPVQILVSTKGGIYRKPCTGMWKFLTEKLNGGVTVDISQSFYVGDAAGRPKDWVPKKKKDFSCSDRLFALNLGMKFKTPEEYFQGYPEAKFTMPSFDPRTLKSDIPLLDPKDAELVSGTQGMILLCGFPACGKSFFAKKYLAPKGYVYVNRDTLSTQQKCISACKDALKKNQCVVVDNTNPDVESRAKYLSLAKEYRVPCRCFMFKTSMEHVKHNERFREITDKSHTPINDMIMNSFAKKYVPPQKTEGFTEIVTVNFVPKFKDPKLEELYRMFLLEK